jgi:hypothetical protein
MLIEWTEEGAPRSVFVAAPFAPSVARVLADDVGVVRLNGEHVTGPASDGDRALYLQWEQGPDPGGEG